MGASELAGASMPSRRSRLPPSTAAISSLDSLAAAGDVQAANQPHAATAIPGAKLVELDGGVFVMDERPAAVAEAVAGFLDEEPCGDRRTG